MIRPSLCVLAGIAALLPSGITAAPTWPSSMDELEDIMLLNTGYRARAFSAAVTPCGFSAEGVGRMASAEWLRTAFHDMAPGNAYTKVGGMDASIVFEANGGDNVGPAFKTTLTTFAPFFSSRSSMADIISLGVYTSVRACGGPVVAIRTGRKDATESGAPGVPQPQNDISIFKNQFLRMGFNTQEMIGLVACGHTIGGVHSDNFPQIVPVGSGTGATGFKPMDSTSDVFDNKIATEYVDSTTQNPLVVGVSRTNSRDADNRVFKEDGNVTIRSFAADPATFRSTCASLLQRMTELVPAGVALTDPITAYDVKPYALQLTLQSGGNSISFSGDIRVRTTTRAAGQISSVQLVYKDRNGGTGGTISTTVKGDAAGFDDSFTFYGFSTTISATTSISSFTVVITTAGGTETYDNNGSGFPVQDNIMMQASQSCLSGNNLTVVAAVRNTVTSPSPSLTVTVKTPRSSGIVVPALTTATANMIQRSSVGQYNIYAASYTIDTALAQTAKFDVSYGSGAGLVADSFKDVNALAATCGSLDGSSSSSSSSVASSTSTSSTVSSSSSTSATPSSSAYAYQGCYKDNVDGKRAFTGAYTANNLMTVEACSSFCSSYQWSAIEYGQECYCGNSRDPASTLVADSECSFSCPGNAAQKCGAGDRLSVYKNLQYAPVTNPTIDGYTYQGCYTEGTDGRALSDKSTASDTMTVQTCATYCAGSTWFGVEYSSECYCGATLKASSTKVAETECSMLCKGNNKQYCGNGGRLNIYKLGTSSSSSSSSAMPTASSSSASPSSSSSIAILSSSSSVASSASPSSSSSSASSSSSSSSSTPASSSISSTSSSSSSAAPSSSPSGPSFSGYTYQGCLSEPTGGRLLSAKSTASNTMTYASCASFCSGYLYMGLEYSGECYCGDAYSVSPATVNADSACGMTCSGDATQKCGDGGKLNVFKSNTTPKKPGPATVSGWTYTGCRVDNINGRVLNAKAYYNNGMTIEACLTACAGYTYAAAEYGSECYCGNAFAGPTNTAPESECSFVCPGNNMELCGAGNRLSLYTKA